MITTEASETVTRYPLTQVPCYYDKPGSIVEVVVVGRESGPIIVLSVGPPGVRCDPWTRLSAFEARQVADGLSAAADALESEFPSGNRLGDIEHIR